MISGVRVHLTPMLWVGKELNTVNFFYCTHTASIKIVATTIAIIFIIKKRKTRLCVTDCVRSVIHKELCKRLKFDHTDKWCMYKRKFVLENETHKILWSFLIQKSHSIPVRRPDLFLIKVNLSSGWFCCSGRPLNEMKESRNINENLNFVCELKKLWTMNVTVIPIVVGVFGMGLNRKLEELEVTKVKLRPSSLKHYSAGILRRVQENWENLL